MFTERDFLRRGVFDFLPTFFFEPAGAFFRNLRPDRGFSQNSWLSLEKCKTAVERRVSNSAPLDHSTRPSSPPSATVIWKGTWLARSGISASRLSASKSNLISWTQLLAVQRLDLSGIGLEYHLTILP